MAGRQRRFGVRARVVASFLVLLAVAELASIVVLHQVGDRRIDDQVTRNLGSSADDLRARLTSVEGTLGEPGGPTFADVVTEHLGTQPARADEAQLAFVDGQPFAVSSGAPVPLADLAIASTWSTLPRTTTGSLDTDAGEMRWLAVPVRSGDRLLGVYVTTAFVAGDYLPNDPLTSAKTVATSSACTVMRSSPLPSSSCRGIPVSRQRSRIRLRKGSRVPLASHTFRHRRGWDSSRAQTALRP